MQKINKAAFLFKILMMVIALVVVIKVQRMLTPDFISRIMAGLTLQQAHPTTIKR